MLCGVPQGFHLGLILFSLHVSDAQKTLLIRSFCSIRMTRNYLVGLIPPKNTLFIKEIKTCLFRGVNEMTWRRIYLNAKY